MMNDIRDIDEFEGDSVDIYNWNGIWNSMIIFILFFIPIFESLFGLNKSINFYPDFFNFIHFKSGNFGLVYKNLSKQFTSQTHTHATIRTSSTLVQQLLTHPSI